MQIRKHGQAMVELALVLPIFLIVILGIIDFGRVFHCWSSLNHQCVQASRVATIRLNPLIARNHFSDKTHQTLEAAAKEFNRLRSPMMNTGDYTVQSSTGDSVPVYFTHTGIGTADREVIVQASYNINIITPLLGSLVGGENKSGHMTIHATARANKE
ncbi:MAG TPA: TadE/TadG family type IV pilus assembly protein [Lentimicrobium sp.]|nr:TadE/TadG family type IV pilus assembly protein [Lentimicrobium sp.]